VAFRGHPRRGGVVEDIVNTSAILGQGAWTRGPKGELFYLSAQGMMMLPADSTQPPTRVSQNSIPIGFLGPAGSQLYTYGDTKIAMAYDTKWNVIHMTNRDSEGRGWFFDLKTGGFHEWELPPGTNPDDGFPYAMIEFEPILQSDSQSAVVMVGEFGVKLFGGQGEEGYVAQLGIGAIALGSDSTKMGMIESVKVMGRYDAVHNGTLTFATGIDARDAIFNLTGTNASYRYTVNIDTLYNNNGICTPKLSGAFVAMRLEIPGLGGLSGGSYFALEEISLEVSPLGWIRRMRTNPN